MARSIDPIKFEVIRNAFVEATEEMAVALRRSAYSTNIKTRCDFSCALFDSKLRAIAQSFSQPNHLGSMVKTVQRSVTAYESEHLGEGDVLVVNYPYIGGVHLNDICLISPVYYQGTLVAYVANLAHHVDVGGGAPASVGSFKEIYQEGVIIPPVKLVSSGKIVPDVMNFIMAQVRSKKETAGDFRAQIASNNTGARRLHSLLDSSGLETVWTYMDELIDYGARRTKQAIAMLPRGEYEAEGYLDNDGFTENPVLLKAKVIIEEDGVTFDLSGSDLQRNAPVNSTYAQTYSACAFVLKCIIDPDIPVNEGFYRYVNVNAPEGTVVNCVHPFPVVGGWETQDRLTDVIIKALSVPMPNEMIAGTKAMICHAGFGGQRPNSGDFYCFLETVAGGFGGRVSSDGPDAVQAHGQNTQNAPVEETEINYPVRILRYELVDDSEGPGTFRGGLGVRRDYLFPYTPALFTVLADRDRWGPWGLFGGGSGKKASYRYVSDTEEIELSSKTTVDLNVGDVMSYETCGGGGYGPPDVRTPELVLRDVREGKVSQERARSVYKVAIDTENWTIDEQATKKLRN